MALRGGLGTVAITREHRLHKNAVFPYNLIRPEPVGIELKTVTCQTLMDAVANSTQRGKRTSGNDGIGLAPMSYRGNSSRILSFAPGE